MSRSNSSHSKKTKVMSETEEIEALSTYLLQCPATVVSRGSRILQVALAALDTERKRIERDAKLQRKFSNEANVTNKNAASGNGKSSKTKTADAATESITNNTTRVHSTRNHHRNSVKGDEDDDDDDELMEWQDVPPEHVDAAQAASDGGSLLGRRLAQAAIASMAQAQVAVTTPLGAVALALHAALCSDLLQFACTGIPESSETTTSVKGGFAPPIRELPKTQLMPQQWERHAKNHEKPHVTFRYRKTGVGSVLLSVAMEDDMVRVELTPTKSKEPPTNMTFPLMDHVNLESLTRALASSSSHQALPALHYKSLPVLLTNLCNTFDLGPVQEQEAVDEDAQGVTTTTLPYVDTTVVTTTTTTTTTTTMPPSQVDPLRVGGSSGGAARLPPRGYQPEDQFDTPSVHVFQPQHPRPGDFSGDLMPGGGIPDPNFVGGGNLMGPNHPAFGGGMGGGGSRGGGGGIGGGGFGMKPRFDPYYPPGGPTDPNQDQRPDQQQQPPKGRRPPPGGSGVPNPDHERPPNNLSNNMFL